MSLDKSDYFSLFGLPKIFTLNNSALKSRYYQLQQAVHPDKFVNSANTEKKAALLQSATINEAYQVLCSPLKRAIYLLTLQGVDIQSEIDTALDTAFLDEQFALRERMAEGEYKAIYDVVSNTLKEYENKLSQILDNTTLSQDALEKARQIVRKMQFYDHLSQDLQEQQEI
ncbi:MAG: Fe-S protein assembly co-chaperone HscB [Proteobacteria bacterium]|nr:Fe-S protein assembly co-chaperone HscB [Pseudomonadota bacterium]